MALRLALWCGTVRLPLSPQSAYTSIRQLPFESRGEAGFLQIIDISLPLHRFPNRITLNCVVVSQSP